MAKITKKSMSVSDLVVDKALNVRLPDNYDIGTMKDGILSHGRIVKAITVEHTSDGRYVVLAGNRRTLAGQEMLTDPSTPQDVVANLKKTDCVVYSGLDEAERIALIADHDEKPLNRTELVLLVWRLSRQFMSEAQIAVMLYYQLASYTGNRKKLVEVPNDPAKRKEFVKKWFHGTLGNYMLVAQRLGEFVRDQFIKTHLSEDKLLPADQSVEMRCNRDRIAKLDQAKTADEKAGEWNAEQTTGPRFNALIEQFKAEDAGTIDTEKVKRPSVKDLKEKAEVFKSPGIRKALLLAAGVTGDEVSGIVDEDDKAARDVGVINVLVRYADQLPDYLRQFVGVVTTKSPAEVEAHCKALTSSNSQSADNRQTVNS
jgi:hypothetical protein